MALVELIPPEDATHRQIDFPTMYSDAKGMIWENIFQFPGGAPESIVWGKYAPRPEDIHRIGSERETKTRARNPGMRYAGFISSTAGAVRAISTRPGHGFSVVHAPAEGIHHAEISYNPGADRRVDQLKRGEKNELKLSAAQGFRRSRLVLSRVMADARANYLTTRRALRAVLPECCRVEGGPGPRSAEPRG